VATRPSPIDLSVPATTRTGVDPVSDEGLVREMIGGSEAALSSLYDRHVNVVFAAAMRTSKDRGIAAEVVQETFLALWNQAERFDPVRGSLLSWLLTIARNRAIDRLRAAGRHDRAATFSSFGHAERDDLSTAEWLTWSGELIGSGEPEPTPEAALTGREDRASIEAAVAALDPMERAVIALAYGSGLSQSEIAARLDWPIGTVKTRTRRALRRLRGRLEESHRNARASDARPSNALPARTPSGTAVGPIRAASKADERGGGRRSAVDPGRSPTAMTPCQC
jgi:RNA polymerase sigma-70 factor, ECF subfamily